MFFTPNNMEQTHTTIDIFHKGIIQIKSSNNSYFQVCSQTSKAGSFFGKILDLFRMYTTQGTLEKCLIPL